MAAPTKTGVGDGVVVSYATDSAFTALLNLENVKGPKVVSPKVETTIITAGAETSQGGIVDSGDVGISFQYNQTQAQAIAALQISKTSLNWKIQSADQNTSSNSTATGSLMTFVGWIKEFEPVAGWDRNKVLMSSLTVNVSGTLTLA